MKISPNILPSLQSVFYETAIIVDSIIAINAKNISVR